MFLSVQEARAWAKMANHFAISVVGESLRRLLNACFKAHPPISDRTTSCVLARTEDFDRSTGTTSSISLPSLSLYLYQVRANKEMRAAYSAVAARDGRSRLPLDLCYLLTPWADNAEHEHAILGVAMECLETTPILSGPLLVDGADWETEEAVQVVVDEISTEAVMRTFDSLPHDYKLSVPYVARVVHIDSRTVRSPQEVGTAVTGITPEARP